MAHDPDSFNDPALPYKHELTLCGHTHGGQVKLPLFGAVTAASDLLSPYTEGWYFQGEKNFLSHGESAQVWSRSVTSAPLKL